MWKAVEKIFWCWVLVPGKDHSLVFPIRLETPSMSAMGMLRQQCAGDATPPGWLTPRRSAKGPAKNSSFIGMSGFGKEQSGCWMRLKGKQFRARHCNRDVGQSVRYALFQRKQFPEKICSREPQVIVHDDRACFSHERAEPNEGGSHDCSAA